MCSDTRSNVRFSFLHSSFNHMFGLLLGGTEVFLSIGLCQVNMSQLSRGVVIFGFDYALIIHSHHAD